MVENFQVIFKLLPTNGYSLLYHKRSFNRAEGVARPHLPDSFSNISLRLTVAAR